MVRGLIGKKLGMTQVFLPDGTLVPVTVLQVGPCTVVQVKTLHSDGYSAVQIGFGRRRPQTVSKALRGHQSKAGAEEVFEALQEVRPVEGVSYQVGQKITASDVFKVGDKVVVTGRTKGRGFTGVMKRHGFGGFPGSHGTHEYFRHGGSIGNRSFPGRVFKGKRMAGHWGNERATIRNIVVIEVNGDVVVVKGSVPGPAGSHVLVQQGFGGNGYANAA